MTDKKFFRPLELPPLDYPYPFYRELQACAGLLTFVKHRMDGFRFDYDEPVDEVVAIEFARATNTYEAILHLALDGFGAQGEMLLRPLYEAGLTAAWARLNPDIVRDRYPLNRKYLRLLSVRARKEARIFLDVGQADPLDAEEEAAAARLFGRYGEKSWTGRSLREMAKEVSERRDEADAMHGAAYLDVIHRAINWQLHSTGLGYWRTVGDEDGVPYAWLGPSDLGVRDALDMAWNSYMSAVGAVSVHYDIGLDQDWGPVVYEVWAAFKDPEQVRALGRNDPCLCQSGLKFKQCHGRFKP